MRISIPGTFAFPVHVGSCVETGRRFRHQAHTHIHGSYKGWVCVLSAKRLADRQLILHEAAHVLALEGHTDKWRRVLLALGGTLNATENQYDQHKRKKKLGRWRGLYRDHSPACPCRDTIEERFAFLVQWKLKGGELWRGKNGSALRKTATDGGQQSR